METQTNNPYKLLVLILTLAILAMAAGGAYAFKHFNDELLMRPKIISVDMSRLIVRAVPFQSDDANVKEKMEAKMKAIQSTIDAYKANGYIVLDKNALIAAPDGFEIGESDLAEAQAKGNE